MKCFIQPYDGDEPYIFVSFCHKDEANVYPMIERLVVDGYRVWFDDGLHPGDDWPDVIAEHLYNSTTCLIVASSAYVQSSNCKNEMTFAINYNKPIVSVILEKFNMPNGLKMQICRSFSLNYYEFLPSPEKFYSELESSQILTQCRKSGHLTDHYALAEWKKHVEEYQKAKKPTGYAKFPLPVYENGYVEDEDIMIKVQDEDIQQDSGNHAPNDVAAANATNEVSSQGRGEHDPNEVTVTNVLDEENPQDDGEHDPNDETVIKVTVKEPTKDDGHDPYDVTVDIHSPSSAEQADDGATVKKRPKPVPTKAILVYLKTGELYRIKKDEISLGRDKKQADFVIGDYEESPVSRHHADISSKDDKFYLRDNDSTNGTFFHGSRLEEQPVELSSFDEFLFAEEEEEKLIFASGENMIRIRGTEKSGFFATLTAEKTGELRVLGKEGILLDRNHPWQNGVLEDKHISHKHAQISLEEDGFELQDLKSKNGTTVNDEAIIPFEKRRLNNGDIIKVVDTSFKFSLYQLNTEKSEVQE